MHKAQSLINHVVLVLDASASMRGHASALVKATDEQIKHLAKRSQELNQETRVTIYRFGSETIECLIFDMDVARLPSTADLYAVLYENTALIDATIKSQEDLRTTSQLYGDHAFLTFVLTDGAENDSRKRASDLMRELQFMPVNWSMGWLVPNESGVRYLSSLGVLKDSIAKWDTTSSAGLDAAVSQIKDATDRFMTARTRGVHGTRSVFSTGADAVNKNTVKVLTALDMSKYGIYKVQQDSQIDNAVRQIGLSYKAGIGYYQLTKTETIQPQKKIIVVEKKTAKAYTGDEARHLIGLPDGKPVRVKPDFNPNYDIYVQSTSYNRKLKANTNILVMP